MERLALHIAPAGLVPAARPANVVINGMEDVWTWLCAKACDVVAIVESTRALTQRRRRRTETFEMWNIVGNLYGVRWLCDIEN
jgi:hypothetical protein